MSGLLDRAHALDGQEFVQRVTRGVWEPVRNVYDHGSGNVEQNAVNFLVYDEG